MDERNPDLRPMLRARLDAGLVELGEHPESEVLEDLKHGKLGVEREREVRDHLSLCRVCADYFLALSDFEELGAEATEEASEDERRAAWSLLRQEILRIPAGRGTRRPETRHLLAALLAMVALGLALLSWRLHRSERQRQDAVSELSMHLNQERDRSAGLLARSHEQDERIATLEGELAMLSRPQVNTPVVDLVPRLARGSREPIAQIQPEATYFTLVIEPAEGREYPVYSAEMFDSDGRSLATIAGLKRTEFGNLTLSLTRRFLPNGEIRLRLYGVQGGRRVECGDYAFSIQNPQP